MAAMTTSTGPATQEIDAGAGDAPFSGMSALRSARRPVEVGSLLLCTAAAAAAAAAGVAGPWYMAYGPTLP